MPSVLSKLVPFAVAGTVLLTHAVLLRRSHAKHHEQQESEQLHTTPIADAEANEAWALHRAATVVQSWVRVASARLLAVALPPATPRTQGRAGRWQRRRRQQRSCEWWP